MSSIISYFEGNHKKARHLCFTLQTNDWLSTEVKGYHEFIKGSILRSLGEIDLAVLHFHKVFTHIKEGSIFEVYRSFTFYHLGAINLLFEDKDDAEKNFQHSYKSALLTDNITAKFRSCLGLGSLYIQNGVYEKAGEFLYKAGEFTYNQATESVLNYELANLYFQSEKYERALKIIDKVILSRSESKLRDAGNTALLLKAKILLKQERLEEAFYIAREVLPRLRKLKTKVKERDCLKILSRISEIKKKYEEAYFYLKAYTLLDEDLNKTQFHEILKNKNQFIQEQKDEIEKQHKEIKYSIQYSSRLQNAILPPLELITRHLPENFILYMPKDIVSGDFYWVNVPEFRNREEDKDWVLFASADCTGHGVPGAIVSFICSDLLDRAVNEYNLLEPAEILDKVDRLLLSRFKMSKTMIMDGMDLSLAALNVKTLELKWAGACNPLLYFSDDELVKIKGDRQGIGYGQKLKSFTEHQIQMKKGDMIYLGTDGYFDQFGGKRGKKMGQQLYKEKLKEIHTKPLKQQKVILESYLLNWKQNREQLDDICIFGVRV